jgi:acyl carrier protein
MAIFEETLDILDRTLSLGGRARRFSRETRLLGSLPELDSMAVVAIITGLEERFGFEVLDEEISADTFESVGSLVQLVETKLANAPS